MKFWTYVQIGSPLPTLYPSTDKNKFRQVLLLSTLPTYRIKARSSIDHTLHFKRQITNEGNLWTQKILSGCFYIFYKIYHLNPLNNMEHIFGHCGTLPAKALRTLLDLHGHQNRPLNRPCEADFKKTKKQALLLLG